MSQGDHRTQRKLDLEAESDIKHHQTQCCEHGDTAVVSQLLAHLGSDKFDPAQLDAHLGRCPKLVDHQRTLLIRITVGQAHQHILIGTKADHHGAVVTFLIKNRANRTQISAITIGDLDESAAREI